MPEIEDDDDDTEDDDLVIFPLTDLNGDSGNSSDTERCAFTVDSCSMLYFHFLVLRITDIFINN